jgi:hypothetical protein
MPCSSACEAASGPFTAGAGHWCVGKAADAVWPGCTALACGQSDLPPVLGLDTCSTDRAKAPQRVIRARRVSSCSTRVHVSSACRSARARRTWCRGSCGESPRSGLARPRRCATLGCATQPPSARPCYRMLWCPSGCGRRRGGHGVGAQARVVQEIGKRGSRRRPGEGGEAVAVASEVVATAVEGHWRHVCLCFRPGGVSLAGRCVGHGDAAAA